MWGELSLCEFSLGRVVLGRVVFGASCPDPDGTWSSTSKCQVVRVLTTSSKITTGSEQT